MATVEEPKKDENPKVDKAPKAPTKKVMYQAVKANLRNPFTGLRISKGECRPIAKLDNWDKCQLKDGYLKKVKV